MRRSGFVWLMVFQVSYWRAASADVAVLQRVQGVPEGEVENAEEDDDAGGLGAGGPAGDLDAARRSSPVTAARMNRQATAAM